MASLVYQPAGKGGGRNGQRRGRRNGQIMSLQSWIVQTSIFLWMYIYTIHTYIFLVHIIQYIQEWFTHSCEHLHDKHLIWTYSVLW